MTSWKVVVFVLRRCNLVIDATEKFWFSQDRLLLVGCSLPLSH